MINLYNDDCLKILKELDDNTIDSMITDPPAGIGFMNKSWDNDKGGRNNWINWLKEIMIEAKRVLKPGGHCFVWAMPRTSHWTATAMENAGFEIRDIVTHVFGSGFPKSLNISIAIDKQKGLQKHRSKAFVTAGQGAQKDKDTGGNLPSPNPEFMGIKYDGKSQEAKQWEGWGTALKPASEHWILCRKPLSEKTIADNVLKYGTGGINIDDSRIGYVNENDKPKETDMVNIKSGGEGKNGSRLMLSASGRKREVLEDRNWIPDNTGRFPSNFMHDGSDEVINEFEKAGYSKSVVMAFNSQGGKVIQSSKIRIEKEDSNSYNDEGTAARFFYCSKASGKEKNEGLDELEDKELSGQVNVNKCGKCGLYFQAGDGRELCKCDEPIIVKPVGKNNHPTIKPVKLMTYLIKMITPPNGTVLDPFMGSGSTGVAAIKSGFNFIGIELEADYFEIAEARINYTNNMKKQ